MPDASAETVAEAVKAAFPGAMDRIDPADMERALRPFSPVPFEVGEQVRGLLRGCISFRTRQEVAHWLEADFAVNGGHAMHRTRVRFLLNDPCECTLPYLPAAVAHAQGDVYLRLRHLALMAAEGRAAELPRGNTPFQA
jgi:hypothetical protein